MLFVHLESGNSPIIFSVPHDGGVKLFGEMRLEARRWQERDGQDWRDEGTLALARACGERLRSFGRRPSIIWFEVHRAFIDVNRASDSEPCHEALVHHYLAFHAAMDNAIGDTLARHGHCLLVDLHGYVHSPGPEQYDVVVGSDGHRTAAFGADQRIVTLLQEKYRTVFSPDHHLGIDSRYRGGWIVRRAATKFGSRGLEAVQLEFNAHLRQADVIPEVAAQLARALDSFSYA